MTDKPDSALSTFTVPLMLGIGLAFVGGSIEGPTWAKLALICSAIALILFSAMRRITLAKARQNSDRQSEPGPPGPHA